jgi:O-acetylserine/cysteine efflux transporter
VVIQTQVFFTIGLSMLWMRERPRPVLWIAMALAVAGLGLIALHTDGSTTVWGLLIVLCAAFSWAVGNLVGQRAGQVNMLAYVVWSSLFAVPPLLVLSLVFEGHQAMIQGLRQADAATWLAVLWQSLGNTLFGYAAWGWLLSRHSAAAIVPTALLVPVFGLAAASAWLAEALPPWKLAAAALVMAGLGLNLLWPYATHAWRQRTV